MSDQIVPKWHEDFNYCKLHFTRKYEQCRGKAQHTFWNINTIYTWTDRHACVHSVGKFHISYELCLEIGKVNTKYFQQSSHVYIKRETMCVMSSTN